MTASVQWEYGRVYFIRNKAGVYMAAWYSSNLRTNTRLEAGIDLDVCLAVLGDGGWELVGILGHEAKPHLLFKRPKP